MNLKQITTAKITGTVETSLSGDATRLFPWWSVTKTVLATTALQLADQGHLALDEKLWNSPYSLRQLLQHRAGVPEYGRLETYHAAVDRGDTPWSPQEMLERVKVEQLDFEPGTGWAYSNVGYLLIRQFIERVMGADIETVMQEQVFGPLQLPSVRLARNPDDLANTAWGNGAGYHPGWVYHGLLIGSAVDAALFMNRILTGPLLSPKFRETMTSPFEIGDSIADRPWRTHGYGLGVMMGQVADAGLAIGHSGCGAGSVCAVYHFPELDTPSTTAAFAQVANEGETEWAAVQLATAP
ncbi:beta-lactamase family protein [Sneathiella marina]|uniref:Beta-lactamase family protein n=1 Tax=Sneathiella marina TaxID=2950108 RepID=A0ABY4VZA5_9PROT|nr:serine hydrolase domain-containing protein [Sneathiella marina]USG60168.1 beta-lactamase family protein [Sneathiella marina]